MEDRESRRRLAGQALARQRAAELTAAEFVHEWARAGGMREEQLAAWIESFGDQDWAAVDASRRERWPGDAPIQRNVLAAATFPKVLASPL